MRVVERQVFPQGRGPNDPRWLIVHETANPGATALNHVSYWATGNQHGEAHYVADWTGDVYHTTPDHRATWNVGGAANACTVGIELCHATNRADFDRVWEAGVEFCAWWLARRGWGAERMMSHREANARLSTGSDHTDPDGYFAEFGRTWGQFKQEVKRRLEDYDMSDAYDYLTEKTDASGRGKLANVRDRLAWMAEKQERMQSDIDGLKATLAKIAKKLGA